MDKKKSGLLLLTLPLFVNASSKYDDAVFKANNYITNFTDYQKYILNYNKDNIFKKGGLLSKEEFLISHENGNSYLAPGIQYWTSTPGSKKETRYVIDYSLKELAEAKLSGVRVTEYVRPSTIVTGKGTINNPWEFVKSYKVAVTSSNENYGKIAADSAIQYIKAGEDVIIKFTAEQGYKYSGSNCKSVNVTQNGNEIKINGVDRDLNCQIIFAPRDDIQYTVKYYEENANDNNYTVATGKEQKLKGTTNSEVSVNPTIPTGFEMDGLKSTTNGIIKPDGSLELNIYLKRKTYLLTLEKGTGIGSVTGAGTYKYQQKVDIDASVNSGYTWSKWTGNQEDIKKDYSFIMPNSNITLKANATENPPSPSYGGNSGGDSGGYSGGGSEQSGYQVYDSDGNFVKYYDNKEAAKREAEKIGGKAYYDYVGGKTCISNC